MAWRPDEVQTLPDGSRREIKYRRFWGPGRPGRSRMVRLYGPDGALREVRHEVLDVDGNVIHADEKPIRRQAT